MFRHGSVHCDPHGANVLVRPHPSAKNGSERPQLVLLDHGLYRELTEQFRVDHCRLWKAMVFKDVPGMIETGLRVSLYVVRTFSGRFSRCLLTVSQAPLLVALGRSSTVSACKRGKRAGGGREKE